MVNEYDIGRIPALTFLPKEFLHFVKTQVISLECTCNPDGDAIAFPAYIYNRRLCLHYDYTSS